MQIALLTRHLIAKHPACRLNAASMATLQPKLYALQYDYVADALEKRKPHREAHLSFIGEQVKKGNLVIGGALDHPPTGGLLILRNLSHDEIEKLAKQDPYVTHGVVLKYTIKPYMAVVGDALLNNDLIKI